MQPEEDGVTMDKRIPKARVQAAVLRGALKDVGAIVEGRNTIPILSHVLLEVADQWITLTASDLDHWAVRTCASSDRDGPDSREWLKSIRGFSVCLPAKPLEAVLGGIDGDAMVRIEAPADIDANWAGQVTLTAGRARWKLHALPVAEFPAIGGFAVESEFEMPCSQLADALAAVDHAISSEETRYYLNGVFLHPADLDLRFAATDGHRLARWSLNGPVGSTSFPATIVSRKTIAVLEKLLAGAAKTGEENSEPPKVVIEANANGTRLRFAMPAEGDGEVEVVAKAIDGEFPDYVRVIPSSPEHRATVDRVALSGAIKRVAVLADGKSRAVKLSFAADMLTVSARSTDLGEASEELTCSYEGPEFELGFDSRYLRDALAAIVSDTVALRFDVGGQPPFRIAGWEDGAEVGSLLQVLMPVRV